MKLFHLLINVLLLAVRTAHAEKICTRSGAGSKKCALNSAGACPPPCELVDVEVGLPDVTIEPIVTSEVPAGGIAPEKKGRNVEGIVWNEDEGRGEKKVVVKLYRIYSKSKKEKVVGKTKTKADGSYKFIVEGSKSFLKGDFYVRVRKPKGLIFTTVKGKESNINLLTGRTEQFRIKSGTTVSQNAYLQSEATLQGRGSRRTKYQQYRDDACNDAFGEGSIWDGHQTATSDGNIISCATSHVRGGPPGSEPGSVIMITPPVGSPEIKPIDEIEIDVGHCGCDECTCCCVSSPCTCCNKCDNPNSNQILDEIEEIRARGPSCTRKICVVVFENPDRDWSQGPDEAGIPGVDVAFTIVIPQTPPGANPGVVALYFNTLVTDSNGQTCFSGIPIDDAFGPTKVTVDIDDTTMPPLMQNLGTDSTLHIMTCARSTYWDINGYE